MDRPDMQTPDDAVARYSFLFPIGESRRFKPSHPTIGAMCVNATLPLASRARRPRDLLPHSAPSGRCCSRSAGPRFCPRSPSTPRGPRILLRRISPHSASAVLPFPSVRPSAAATRLPPGWPHAQHGDYVCVNAVSSPCISVFHHVCCVHGGTRGLSSVVDAFPSPDPTGVHRNIKFSTLRLV